MVTECHQPCRGPLASDGSRVDDSYRQDIVLALQPCRHPLIILSPVARTCAAAPTRLQRPPRVQPRVTNKFATVSPLLSQ